MDVVTDDEHILVAAIEGAHYVASCTCGWAGPERASLPDADADKLTHMYERGILTPEEVANAPVVHVNGSHPRTVVQTKAHLYAAMATAFMAGAWLFTVFTLMGGVNVFYTLAAVQVIVTVNALRLYVKARRSR